MSGRASLPVQGCERPDPSRQDHHHDQTAFSPATSSLDGHWAGWRTPGSAGTMLTAVISGLLESAAAATAAFANSIPVGDGSTLPITQVPPLPFRVISAGGMAGWQVAHDRGRGSPGRRSRCRTAGPQADWPPRRYRHHRLMHLSATAPCVCPDGRPLGPDVRQARVCLQPGLAGRDGPAGRPGNDVQLFAATRLSRAVLAYACDEGPSGRGRSEVEH
jgi:hypothetical protein